MKKLMKAIAFATVMCMLLSVSAFAANPDAVLDAETDYKFDVTVTTGGPDQVALLILKNGTELEDAASGNILYINQEAAVAVENGGYAVTFEDVQVDGEDVTNGKVDIYAGYATAGGVAVDYKNFVVVNQEEISISLVGEPEIHLDIEAWVNEYLKDETADATIKAQLDAIARPENDKATVVLTTVKFAIGDKTVSRMVWKFGIADGTARYIEVDPSAYGLDSEALEGSVKLGVSFINGSKNGSRTALEVNDADLLFALSDESKHSTEN